MLKFLFTFVSVLVLGFVIMAASRPSDFRVERSTVISAPPAKIFGHINDLQRFQEWSPWAKMDPEAKTAFEGSTAGTGAVFSWDGKKSGTGTMTVTESKPSEQVAFRLDFQKPFVATNNATFDLKPIGNQTRVTWAMFGKNNFAMKAMSLFVNSDRMLGDQFEEGLADLKSVVEASNEN